MRIETKVTFTDVYEAVAVLSAYTTSPRDPRHTLACEFIGIERPFDNSPAINRKIVQEAARIVAQHFGVKED